MKRAKPLSERFAEQTLPEPNTGCLLWTGAVSGFGYGVIGSGGRGGQTIKAHRLAWEMAHGAVPDGLCVLHKCDTPACVNASHLFLGTRQANVDDMMAKGRHRVGVRHSGDRHWTKLKPERVARGDRAGPRAHPESYSGANHWTRRFPGRVRRGEASHTSKLTDADVVEIRAMRAAGAKLVAIAERFGISQSHASAIAKGKARI